MRSGQCCDKFVYEVHGKFYTDHGPTCEFHVRPSVERMRELSSHLREDLAPEANKVLREMVSTWTDPDEPSEAMLVLIDCMRPSAQEIIEALDRKGYEIRRKSL